MLDASMIADLRAAARQADIDAAAAFGFGGASWYVDRPAGSGTATRTLARVGTVAALVFRQAPGPVAPSAPGVPILADVWRVLQTGLVLTVSGTAVGSGALKAGDVLTSAADTRYVFGIASTEPWYDYTRGDLERRR